MPVEVFSTTVWLCRCRTFSPSFVMHRIILVSHGIFFIQNDVYRQLGELVAASVVQGGSGLHIFNNSVYEYLCGVALTSIRPSVCEIPDAEVRTILDEVGVL